MPGESAYKAGMWLPVRELGATGEPQPSEVSRSPRRRMAFKGSFESVTSKGWVWVRNLSCTGAMLEGDDLPPPGRDIFLTAAGHEFFGTVVWVKRDRCGIHFDEPLTPAEVLKLHSITPELVRAEELNAEAERLKRIILDNL